MFQGRRIPSWISLCDVYPACRICRSSPAESVGLGMQSGSRFRWRDRIPPSRGRTICSASRRRWTPQPARSCEELPGCPYETAQQHSIAKFGHLDNRSAYCIDNAGNRYLLGFMESC